MPRKGLSLFFLPRLPLLMKFLLDENIGKSIARFLVQLGYTTLRVKEIHSGLEDFKVLELAVEQETIVITLDKDYGELVFKEGKFHRGVIFLRLEDQTSSNIQRALSWFLTVYSKDRIGNYFAVVTEKMSKFKTRFNDD